MGLSIPKYMETPNKTPRRKDVPTYIRFAYYHILISWSFWYNRYLTRKFIFSGSRAMGAAAERPHGQPLVRARRLPATKVLTKIGLWLSWIRFVGTIRTYFNEHLRFRNNFLATYFDVAEFKPSGWIKAPKHLGIQLKIVVHVVTWVFDVTAKDIVFFFMAIVLR